MGTPYLATLTWHSCKVRGRNKVSRGQAASCSHCVLYWNFQKFTDAVELEKRKQNQVSPWPSPFPTDHKITTIIKRKLKFSSSAFYKAKIIMGFLFSFQGRFTKSNINLSSILLMFRTSSVSISFHLYWYMNILKWTYLNLKALHLVNKNFYLYLWMGKIWLLFSTCLLCMNK